MPRADISSDPSTTSQARLVRETTPVFSRSHGRLGNLSALVPRPPNLVACDLSGGFEFVSAMGLWDLYLQIAGSLGPRRRRGRQRCPRKGRKGVTIGVEAWNFNRKVLDIQTFLSSLHCAWKMPSLHPSMRSAASSLFELVNQGSPAMQRSLPWTGVRSCVCSTLQFPVAIGAPSMSNHPIRARHPPSPCDSSCCSSRTGVSPFWSIRCTIGIHWSCSNTCTLSNMRQMQKLRRCLMHYPKTHVLSRSLQLENGPFESWQPQVYSLFFLCVRVQGQLATERGLNNTLSKYLPQISCSIMQLWDPKVQTHGLKVRSPLLVLNAIAVNG